MPYMTACALKALCGVRSGNLIATVAALWPPLLLPCNGCICLVASSAPASSSAVPAALLLRAAPPELPAGLLQVQSAKVDVHGTTTTATNVQSRNTGLCHPMTLTATICAYDPEMSNVSTAVQCRACWVLLGAEQAAAFRQG